MVTQDEVLSAALTRFRESRHRLLGTSAEMDEASIHEALDRVGCLHDAIVAMARSALEDDNAASRLRGKLDMMEAALRRIERRGQGKRDLVLSAMTEAGLERLDATGVSIAVRHAPPLLVVTDEDLVPEVFRVARPALLDYQRIREALERGTGVLGARLADPEPYLSVRTS